MSLAVPPLLLCADVVKEPINFNTAVAGDVNVAVSNFTVHGKSFAIQQLLSYPTETGHNTHTAWLEHIRCIM
jgi:hypothetical protein